MNKQSTTIINVDEIHTLYKEYCEEGGEVFNETRFYKFLKFLEIDLYDWVKDNLRQFEKS